MVSSDGGPLTLTLFLPQIGDLGRGSCQGPPWMLHLASEMGTPAKCLLPMLRKRTRAVCLSRGPNSGVPMFSVLVLSVLLSVP